MTLSALRWPVGHGLGFFHSDLLQVRCREWRPSGDPRRADVRDFPGEQGKAVPYGVYDLGANAGWVPVGSDGDTAQFAVPDHPALVGQRRRRSLTPVPRRS